MSKKITIKEKQICILAGLPCPKRHISFYCVNQDQWNCLDLMTLYDTKTNIVVDKEPTSQYAFNPNQKLLISQLAKDYLGLKTTFNRELAEKALTGYSSSLEKGSKGKPSPPQGNYGYILRTGSQPNTLALTSNYPQTKITGPDDKIPPILNLLINIDKPKLVPSKLDSTKTILIADPAGGSYILDTYNKPKFDHLGELIEFLIKKEVVGPYNLGAEMPSAE